MSVVVPVDILILGAGWTSKFLIPLCESRGLSFAATSRAGGNGTIKFEFGDDGDDEEQYNALPNAQTVLITFPITGNGASTRLVQSYAHTHGQLSETHFIQLGTTSIWDMSAMKDTTSAWFDRQSPVNDHPRARAEAEFLALSSGSVSTTVLNLSGLWGGERSVKNWIGRVLNSKESLRNRGSLHMVHGIDVARAILAVHVQFGLAKGQRWIINDMRVHDLWELAAAWGDPNISGQVDGDASTKQGSVPLDDSDPPGPQPRWVMELMMEEGVRGLPRELNRMGRLLDSREFWTTFGLLPSNARLQ